MFNISQFLDKFKKNIKSSELINTIIISTVFEQTGVEINTKDFEVKNNIIYLKTSPGIKNKLFIYKENLLIEINLKTNLKLIDIR